MLEADILRRLNGQHTRGDDAVADNQDASKSGFSSYSSRGRPSHALLDFLIDIRSEIVLEHDTIGMVVNGRGKRRNKRSSHDLQTSRFAYYGTGTSNSDTDPDGIRELPLVSAFQTTLR
jgi:hypothetical protein